MRGLGFKIKAGRSDPHLRAIRERRLVYPGLRGRREINVTAVATKADSHSNSVSRRVALQPRAAADMTDATLLPLHKRPCRSDASPAMNSRRLIRDPSRWSWSLFC
jgi:hypothetical protein